MSKRKKRPPRSFSVWPLTLASGRPASSPLSRCDLVLVRRDCIREHEIGTLLGPRLDWGAKATLDETNDGVHWAISRPDLDVTGLLDTCCLDGAQLCYKAPTQRTHKVNVSPVLVTRPTPPSRSAERLKAFLGRFGKPPDGATPAPPPPALKPPPRPVLPTAAAKKKRKKTLWVRFVSVPMGGLNRWRRR